MVKNNKVRILKARNSRHGIRASKHSKSTKLHMRHVKTVVRTGKKQVLHAKIHPKHAKRVVAKLPVVVKVAKVSKKELQELKERGMAAAALSRTREAVSEAFFCEYISKAVGSHANNIIGKLLEGPKVDEKLSEALNIKLNETRRVLNVLNSYGIVRYNINKDSNGWLTFMWYIDHNSVATVMEQIRQNTSAKSALPEGCNDFFACPVCSKKQKLVLPFEVAFDNSFKCSCGKGLKNVSREEAESIYSGITV